MQPPDLSMSLSCSLAKSSQLKYRRLNLVCMPPKTKKAAQDLKTCNLCAGDIKTSKDALQCTGSCQTLVHRYCAGVTINRPIAMQDLSKGGYMEVKCTM